MRLGSLFSGIGGFEWGLEKSGLGDTIFQVEIDDYCNKVLELRWPNAKRYRDIREVHGINTHTHENGFQESRAEFKASGNRQFDENTSEIICPHCLPPVDLICGGFPCQPFSVAGKRRGKEDDRFLWPEMLRVITEVNPAFVIGENVSGFVDMALDQVLSDLENIGYETATFVIPACAVNAPHRRDRVFVIAYSKSKGRELWRRSEGDSSRSQERLFGCENSDVADTADNGLHNTRIKRRLQEGAFDSKCSRETIWNESWLEVATEFCRVDDVVPNRVDRLKCLGNAVVPQVSYAIGMILKDWLMLKK